MLRRQTPQLNFFDTEIFSRMIPKDHPLVLIDEKVDFSFVTKTVEHLYDATNGRPSYPPETLFRILFLEVWANLSDVQVCRELRYNVLYRWFCRLTWSDEVPDDTTLVVFRKRLGEDAFQTLFKRIVEQAHEKGCLRGRWAVVDGSKIAAHVAVKNTLSLVREGRKRLLKCLKEEATRELKDLIEPLPDGEYADHEQLLAAEIERGRELIGRLEGRDDEKLASELTVYRSILEGRGVASFADPEARWGFKRKDEPFLGYKVHAACDETGIVTPATNPSWSR